MEKQGCKLQDIKADHFSLRLYQVKYTQKNVTDRCCEFNEDCINAMQQVEINFCGIKAKSKDSPDPCADATSYSLSDIELLMLDEKYLGVTSAALKKLGHSIDSYSKLPKPEKNSILSSLGLDYKIMNLMEGKLKKNELFPGRIIISMYAHENTDGRLDWLDDSSTITHEFMHACMAIKAQQNMEKKSNFSKLYLESWSPEYCKKERMQDWKSLYTELSDLTDGNPEFIQCLS